MGDMDSHEARENYIRRYVGDTSTGGASEARDRYIARMVGEDVNEDEYDESKHFRDENGRFASKGGSASIKVDGPKNSRSFVKEYLKSNPDKAENIKKNAKKCMVVFDGVRNFQKEHPNAEDGTYSATTGKRVEFNDGYSVTFHQNHSVEEPYADYDKKTYAYMCAIAMEELGSTDAYIGYFGNAEVSFHCSNPQKAMAFAVEHNQKSIWNNKRGIAYENSRRNRETNPCADDTDDE